MPPKPNYKHQRAERDRAKKAAKEAKLQDRKRDAAQGKTAEASAPEAVADANAVQGSGE